MVAQQGFGIVEVLAFTRGLSETGLKTTSFHFVITMTEPDSKRIRILHLAIFFILCCLAETFRVIRSHVN